MTTPIAQAVAVVVHVTGFATPDFSDGYVLLQRAPTVRLAPNVWCLPGGSVEPNESLIDAAARETFEEIGVLINRLVDLNVSTFEKVENGQMFQTHFFAGVAIGTPRLVEPDKSSSLVIVPHHLPIHRPLFDGMEQALATGILNPHHVRLIAKP